MLNLTSLRLWLTPEDLLQDLSVAVVMVVDHMRVEPSAVKVTMLVSVVGVRVTLAYTVKLRIMCVCM